MLRPADGAGSDCPHAKKLIEIQETVFGIATAATVCDRWLTKDAPDIDEARDLLKLIIEASERATIIIKA
jgi:hypothetical protein